MADDSRDGLVSADLFSNGSSFGSVVLVIEEVDAELMAQNAAGVVDVLKAHFEGSLLGDTVFCIIISKEVLDELRKKWNILKCIINDKLIVVSFKASFNGPMLVSFDLLLSR